MLWRVIIDGVEEIIILVTELPVQRPKEMGTFSQKQSEILLLRA